MENFDKLPVMLDPEAIMPTRAHESDAGLDLYTPFFIMVPPRGRSVIDTGVHVRIPDGYVGKLESKSGLMRKAGLTCRGTIDAGYTGTIQVVIFNHSDKVYTFEKGDKITQLVIYPIATPSPIQVNGMELTDRGADGFGSTGRQ